MTDGEDFVFNSNGDGKPVKGTKDGSDMLSAPGFNNKLCCRVLYHLEAISGLVFGGTCEEGISIVKARQNKGAHKCCSCFNRQKMSNGADPTEN